MKKNSLTKSGAASIYIVLFTTLLLGIITVSFIRLMISGSRRTSNMDLSQSAYDSAVAGIEDAKIALLKYHECLSQGFSGNGSHACDKIVNAIRNSTKNQTCDGISDALERFREKDGGTVIRETKISDKNADHMKQAYTCIKISEETPDYRSTLNQGDRIRIIPLRTADLNSISKIKFSWFSDENKNKLDYEKYMNAFPKFKAADNFAPPVVALQLFQTAKEFNLSSSRISNYNQTNRGFLMLYPEKGGSSSEISANFLTKSNSKSIDNNPHQVNCVKATDFYCSTTINLPSPIDGTPRNVGSSFILVSLPYGEPETDFSISLCENDDCSKTYNFSGVQAMVDSTGRANDLYRRLEARIEMVDVFYPYPEFAIELQGDTNDDSIKKNFWINRNCWEADNGNYQFCKNNGEL